MPAVRGVGEPCAGEPHARIDVAAGGNRKPVAPARAARNQAPPADPPALAALGDALACIRKDERRAVGAKTRGSRARLV
jgi:hypothetical protein